MWRCILHGNIPTNSPDGTVLGSLSYRENPNDCSHTQGKTGRGTAVSKLKQNLSVGHASSKAPQSVDSGYAPRCKPPKYRGNACGWTEVVARAKFDAIMLAAAGLSWLERPRRAVHVVKFDPGSLSLRSSPGVKTYFKHVPKTSHAQATATPAPLRREFDDQY
ncbi:MAG: hypothetical protein IPO07_17795 [Haliscomenobacter sp.]|nr:hypothetical protein [Haliscomenobacter sp.]